MTAGSDRNKTLVRELFNVFNGADLDALDGLLSDDFVNHEAKDQPRANRQPGPEGMKNVVRWIRGGFSDLRYEELAMVAEDELVAARMMAGGHHTGPYRGKAGDGTGFTRSQMHFFRVSNGKIVEHWANRDDLGAFIQLGFVDADLRRPE